jgi:hypothetical protein
VWAGDAGVFRGAIAAASMQRQVIVQLSHMGRPGILEGSLNSGYMARCGVVQHA